MHFSGLEGNELTVSLEAGETLYFDLHFLRSPKFSRDITPHFWEALAARLFAGKLWEPHLTASSSGTNVLLSGAEPFGCFHVVVVDKDSSMFVRLKHVVAYAFDSGGGFSSSLSLLDPVRWLIGAASSVFVRGPALLVFYGRAVEDVSVAAGEECFADQVIGFSADTPFRISGYLPQEQSVWASLINAVSTTVNIKFEASGRLVKTTLRDERRGRLENLWRIVFVGILCGWLVERLLTADY